VLPCCLPSASTCSCSSDLPGMHLVMASRRWRDCGATRKAGFIISEFEIQREETPLHSRSGVFERLSHQQEHMPRKNRSSFIAQGGHGIEAAGAEGGDVACGKPFSLWRGETSNEIRKGTFSNKLTKNRKSN